MKKSINIFVFITSIVFFYVFYIFVTNSNNITRWQLQTYQNKQNYIFRKIENKAFTAGEWLRFDVSYGFIHAGTAIMAIPEYKTINGRNCFHIKTEAYSAAGFSWIFKVEDKYETFIDVEGIFPWRFEQHIREGNHKADTYTDFDQYNHIAYTKEGKYSIPEYTHDIVSAFYYSRTQDFSNYRLGQKLNLQNFFKDKIYPLDVKFLGRQEIEVDAGSFKCIIIEPLVKEGGLFKHQGRMLVWLTDDDRKIPIKVVTGIIVGSITVELESYSGINGNIDAKK